MRQRGFTLLVYLGMALAVLGMVYALFQFVDSHWETSAGIERGEANKQALWDKANREADARQRKTTAAVAKELVRVDENRLVAERVADKANLNWQEAVRESKRKNVALGVCEPAKPEPRNAVAVEGSGLRVGPNPIGIRVSWGFVGLYDGAFTAWAGAEAGQPLFTALAGIERSEGASSPSPHSPSPYDLGEIIEVHGENARRFSACLRDYTTLKGKIIAAERAWDGAER